MAIILIGKLIIVDYTVACRKMKPHTGTTIHIISMHFGAWHTITHETGQDLNHSCKQKYKAVGLEKKGKQNHGSSTYHSTKHKNTINQNVIKNTIHK